MKKQNDYPQSAKNSRASAPARDRKSDPRSTSDRPSRSEGPRTRFGDSGSSGPFKPKKKFTEKLFNKPTLKKSNFKKMAFDSSVGRNPFADERALRREDTSSERRGDAPRSDARRSDARRSDARPSNREERTPRPRMQQGQGRSFEKPKSDFRPRREEGSSERPSRSGDSRYGAPRRSDARSGDFPRSNSRRDDSRDGDSRNGDSQNGDSRRNDARSGDSRQENDRRSDARNGDSRRFDRDERPARRDERGSEKPGGEFRPRRDDDRRSDKPRGDFQSRRPERRNEGPGKEATPEADSRRVGRFSKAPRYDFTDYESKKVRIKPNSDDDILRLNRYIANAGICSRREADDLIESGQITVNGKVVTEMGHKVKRSDVIKYGKNLLNPEKMVYLLINKPKDYITTTDDPEERKTVMDLVEGACEERIYPVGRLDRNTTGLLLLTNDGELAEKLTHPSGKIRKIYQAELDKAITTEDFEAMQKGFELEDGFIRPDDISIITPDALVVGLEIHSGKNRIVRRMFENFGYEVKKLDRTVFAGLNKKDLPRGKWRFLSEKEVVKLKFML